MANSDATAAVMENKLPALDPVDTTAEPLVVPVRDAPPGRDDLDAADHNTTLGDASQSFSAYCCPITMHARQRCSRFRSWFPDRDLGRRSVNSLRKFSSFIGPGFMISVAYIDPGNYATDIQAGATYRFSLLFIVLLANLFAIFLQSLAIKLGTITGLNLAEACRAYLPRWLNYSLYGLAEIAIIATDLAEV